MACRNPRQPADGVHKCMQTWRAEVHATVALACRNARQNFLTVHEKKIVRPQKLVCKNAPRLACKNARQIKICLYTAVDSSHLACKSARQGRNTSGFFKGRCQQICVQNCTPAMCQIARQLCAKLHASCVQKCTPAVCKSARQLCAEVEPS